MYRKARRMTIDELGKKINKSKATVSKYERGDISIDIETLCQIASVLNVSIIQITDLKPSEPVGARVSPKGFFYHDVLYLYYYDGRANKLMRSYMQIYRDQQTDGIAVTLYWKVASFEHYTNCKILYTGRAYIHDSVVNFLLINQANGIERMNITALNPISNSDKVYAVLNGILDKPFMPVAIKCLFSSYPLAENADLVNELTLSREDIKMLKKLNLFSIDQILN